MCGDLHGFRFDICCAVLSSMLCCVVLRCVVFVQCCVALRFAVLLCVVKHICICHLKCYFTKRTQLGVFNQHKHRNVEGKCPEHDMDQKRENIV